MGSAPADTITPPVYGQMQAEAGESSSAPSSPSNPSSPSSPGGGLDEATAPPWLRELNLDPRLRVAAAAGAQVVQERQEQLMARAWSRPARSATPTRCLRSSQLARELGGVLMERHLAAILARRSCWP